MEKRRRLLMLLIRLHQSLLGKGDQGSWQACGRRFRNDVMLLHVIACGRLMGVAIVQSIVKPQIAQCIGYSRNGVPCPFLCGASTSALIPAILIAVIAGNTVLILSVIITARRRR